MNRVVFSYINLKERLPARHPLRKIRQVVNEALASPDAELKDLYTDFRPVETDQMLRNTYRHRNAEVDLKREKRSNATHASIADPDGQILKLARNRSSHGLRTSQSVYVIHT